jgi:hypothetical protein
MTEREFNVAVRNEIDTTEERNIFQSSYAELFSLPLMTDATLRW